MQSSTCLLLILSFGYLAVGTDALPSGPVLIRQVRQTNPNNIQAFPVKIAGGQDAFRPSVGALSSRPVFNPLSVSSNRFEAPPPIVFGPRPRPRPQTVRPWYFY